MSQTFEIVQLPALSDNYMYLVHDKNEKKTAIIDPTLADPVLDELDKRGWSLDVILNTHHHWDHTDGNLEIKEKTHCLVAGSKTESDRVPGIDLELSEGDEISIGSITGTVLSVNGHTTGHIAFYFPKMNAIFTGDSLFTLGCGRLFEGSAEQMWTSLKKIRTLPDETQIYCGHEYSHQNARFALTIDPKNRELKTRFHNIQDLRQEGRPTIPAPLKLERETNPFLRADNPEIQKNLGCIGDDLATFTEMRKRKDTFR